MPRKAFSCHPLVSPVASRPSSCSSPLLNQPWRCRLERHLQPCNWRGRRHVRPAAAARMMHLLLPPRALCPGLPSFPSCPWAGHEGHGELADMPLVRPEPEALHQLYVKLHKELYEARKTKQKHPRVCVG